MIGKLLNETVGYWYKLGVNVMSLVRFRANPKIIRVGVRKVGDQFLSSVRYTDDYIATHPNKKDVNKVYTWLDTDPRCGNETVLYIAKIHHMDGIDLDMEWSYEHPYKFWIWDAPMSIHISEP
jgi:hypothetical protein